MSAGKAKNVFTQMTYSRSSSAEVNSLNWSRNCDSCKTSLSRISELWLNMQGGYFRLSSSWVIIMRGYLHLLCCYVSEYFLKYTQI